MNRSWPSGAPLSVSGLLIGDVVRNPLPSSKSVLGGESGDGEIGVRRVLWLFGDGISSSNGERDSGLVVSMPMGLVMRGLRLEFK